MKVDPYYQQQNYSPWVCGFQRCTNRA